MVWVSCCHGICDLWCGPNPLCVPYTWIYIYTYISSHGVFLSDPSNPTATTINNQQPTRTNQPPNQPANHPTSPTTQPPHRFQQLIIKTYVGIPRFSAWTNFGACDPVTLQRWKTCVVRGGGEGRRRRDLRKALRLVGKKRAFTRWWFQTFFIFTPIWGRFPIWLIFFKGVETTNQF